MPLISTSVAIMGLWIQWVLTAKHGTWSDTTRIHFATLMRCDQDDIGDDRYAGYDNCLGSFMLWVTPVAVSGSTFLYGLI